MALFIVLFVTKFFFFQPSVDIKTVLSGLMERLSNYAASSIEVCEPVLNLEKF